MKREMKYTRNIKFDINRFYFHYKITQYNLTHNYHKHQIAIIKGWLGNLGSLLMVRKPWFPSFPCQKEASI